MKAKDIHVGEQYQAKVSGKLAIVRISRESPYGGWDAVNMATNRDIRIKSGQRLRYNETIANHFRLHGDLRYLGRSITSGDAPSIERARSLQTLLTLLTAIDGPVI